MEVCYNDSYYPVCGDGWTDNDAAVVCHDWGYSTRYNYRELKTIKFFSLPLHKTGAVATRGSEFGLSDQPPILQNLMCAGNESDLTECSGYHLNNVVGEDCLSGTNQAGFRCIESENNLVSQKV